MRHIESHNELALKRLCKVCYSPLTGRADKRFCNIYCKNAYHQKMRSINIVITARIDQFLHRIRTIFHQIYSEAKQTPLLIPKWKLYRQGFKFQYYTGSFRTKNKQLIFYIYDFAWIQQEDQFIKLIKC